MGQILIALLVDDNTDNRVLMNKFMSANLPNEGDKNRNQPKQKPAKTETPDTEETSGISMDDIKAAAKKAKSAHDEDFVKAVLEACGVEVGKSVARSISKLDEENFETFLELINAGPDEDEDEEDDDDDLDDDDDDDDDDEITADSVKAKLRAYAKESSNKDAKALMKKNGCESLADVAKLSKTKLAKLDAAVDKVL